MQLHPRNRHRFRYDFPELINTCPELAGFVSANSFDVLSINFSDPDAVKALNYALLKHFYGINHWDIPDGFLCPPIPGRADYIHYVADLLGAENNGEIPKGKAVKVLDIGTGANCIYPIIGNKEYRWSFVGSDVDHLAIRSALNIVQANSLSKVIEIRKQTSASKIFDGVIRPGERFDLSICNPPFHSSMEEANLGTQRKWKNLKNKDHAGLNFGGQNTELWCEGGEERFLKTMIRESLNYKESCRWFTSLVSKKDNLPFLYKALKDLGAHDVRTIEMAQGQKVSRVLAWTFAERLQ